MKSIKKNKNEHQIVKADADKAPQCLSQFNDMLIFPPILKGLPVKGFFTTKAINGDLKIISSLADVPISKIYQPIQKHTDKIIFLESDMDKKIADAVITALTGILIGVDVADCVPILLYDKRLQVIAAVHAGWRGTSHQILKKTISKMTHKFSSSPSDILIAMGPAIRQCCYEVGDEVIEAVEKATGAGEYYVQKEQSFFLDLPTANMHQAVSSGVPSLNIWMLNECTYCRPDLFYSYRYSKGKTGRQGGFIGIF